MYLIIQKYYNRQYYFWNLLFFKTRLLFKGDCTERANQWMPFPWASSVHYFFWFLGQGMMASLLLLWQHKTHSPRETIWRSTLLFSLVSLWYVFAESFSNYCHAAFCSLERHKVILRGLEGCWEAELSGADTPRENRLRNHSLQPAHIQQHGCKRYLNSVMRYSFTS